jgi:hypothetical protein
MITGLEVFHSISGQRNTVEPQARPPPNSKDDAVNRTPRDVRPEPAHPDPDLFRVNLHARSVRASAEEGGQPGGDCVQIAEADREPLGAHVFLLGQMLG